MWLPVLSRKVYLTLSFPRRSTVGAAGGITRATMSGLLGLARILAPAAPAICSGKDLVPGAIRPPSGRFRLRQGAAVSSASLKGRSVARIGSRATPTAAMTSRVTFTDNAPSWEALGALLEDRRAATGFVDTDPVTGPTNAKALLRTFGHEGEPRIKLYRDHAAWCPYCHKVWLLLEEKRVPYR